ncbi:hypothetical protein HanIR_Chr01g0016131 [Helianthus annuus]|nr:hypothetical protein HanIR_Chr01g0016131 [Helianthus annuus]
MFNLRRKKLTVNGCSRRPKSSFIFIGSLISLSQTESVGCGGGLKVKKTGVETG